MACTYQACGRCFTSQAAHKRISIYFWAIMKIQQLTLEKLDPFHHPLTCKRGTHRPSSNSLPRPQEVALIRIHDELHFHNLTWFSSWTGGGDFFFGHIFLYLWWILHVLWFFFWTSLCDLNSLVTIFFFFWIQSCLSWFLEVQWSKPHKPMAYQSFKADEKHFSHRESEKVKDMCWLLIKCSKPHRFS